MAISEYKRKIEELTLRNEASNSNSYLEEEDTEDEYE